jgi:glycerol-3-phosphate dehydrogenase
LAQQNSSRNNRYSSEKHSLEPIALETEINLFRNSSRFLAKKPTSRCPFCLCRLRPLAAKEQEKEYQRSSRSHKIIVSDTGLITITGGKWTTYRKNRRRHYRRLRVRH